MALFLFVFNLHVQVDGTQLAAVCKDGTFITWSYPSGEIPSEIFQMNTKQLVYGIKWNPFRQDVFATHHGQVRNEVNS